MKKPEFKKGDVVVVWDTRNFFYAEESEQDSKINMMPVPLGVVESFFNCERVEVYVEYDNMLAYWEFEPESLEKIDHIDPNKKSWGKLAD